MTATGWIIFAVTAAATLVVAVRSLSRSSKPYGLMLAALFVVSNALTYLQVPHALTLNMWADWTDALIVLWLCTQGLRQRPSLNDYRFLLVILLFTQVAAHMVFESRRTADAWWWCQFELNVTFGFMLAVTEFRPRLMDAIRDAFRAVGDCFPDPGTRRRRRSVVARADAFLMRVGECPKKEDIFDKLGERALREKSR